MSQGQNCQICDKDAVFICSDCKKAKYCTIQHRNQHWPKHKQQCKVIKNQKNRQIQKIVNKNRMQIRKKYFQRFNHKIYDECILIAHDLFVLEKNHIQQTKQIFNEFQYGVAVCLLCRTYLLINRPIQAKNQMDQYIRERIHFLQDLRNIPTLKQLPEYTVRAKMFLEKKLTLISAVANIYSQLNVYLNHIEFVFGSESYQLSNAYFCVGNYYRQINQNTKAIACFLKSATIRNKKGGDCYVNISLLYRKQGRIYAAIDMMLTAIKLHEQQYGNNSREVGQVFQKLGLLYLDILDFNNAISCLENALKIYINQKQSDDYERIRLKIEIIYSKLKDADDQENIRQKTSQKIKEQQQMRRIQNIQFHREQLNFNKSVDLQKLFKVSQGFLNRLSSMELFRLSDLQLQLQKHRSQYGVAETVRNSDFFKNLSDNRKRELKSQNQKLFQLINLQLNFQKIDASQN